MSQLDQTITQQAINRIHSDNPRFVFVMESLIRHLHAFVEETELTGEEWMAGIQFLTATGQKCDDVRQEFILLSDILGVSMVQDGVENQRDQGTESSVLGPFYRPNGPAISHGDSIARGDVPSDLLCHCYGRVSDASGQPIANATLDIWQASENGLYEQQDPDQPDMNLRGVLKTDEQGRYHFITLKPPAYGIPVDGPAGQLLNAMGRHNIRPGHIHYIVSADGFKPLVTQVFVAEDEYIESDAVFGVRKGLVGDFKKQGEEWRVDFDFVLERE